MFSAYFVSIYSSCKVLKSGLFILQNGGAKTIQKAQNRKAIIHKINFPEKAIWRKPRARLIDLGCSVAPYRVQSPCIL